MWNFLLFGLAHAYLESTGVVNASTQLASFTGPLRVVFFDFDKTLVVGSTDVLLDACDPSGDCRTYSPPLACTCNTTATTFGDFLINNASARVLAEPDVIFNGTDRRDRIAQTFALIRSKGIELKVVSTSWYDQSAANWQYFISKVFDVANLTQYLPMEDILTLADPGLNLAADKGSLMAAYLANKSWGVHDGLFVDDSPSNIVSANGKVDWLLVTPRSGLAVNQLQYIEARANQTFGSSNNTNTTNTNTTNTNTSKTNTTNNNNNGASSLSALAALFVPIVVSLSVC